MPERCFLKKNKYLVLLLIQTRHMPPTNPKNTIWKYNH